MTDGDKPVPVIPPQRNEEGASDPEDADDDSEEEPEGVSSTHHGPRRIQLRKGHACTKCRYRRMKCDAKLPACTPCIRLKRECTYEYERSRTRRMLDKIQSLQVKLDELQSQRSTGSSEDIPVDPVCDAWLDAAPDSYDAFQAEMTRGNNWWLLDHPPEHIRKRLLDTCINARVFSVSFFHVPRFWEALAPSYEGPPLLPALLNAMYLVGCYLSEDSSLVVLEDHYLARTRQLLSNSLGQRKTSLIQWLRASCLLTFYLLRKCRFLEVRHELAGTIHLITAAGLHKIKSSDLNGWDKVASPATLVPPPKDNIELGEMIWLFWSAYQYDHLTALICGMAPNSQLLSETETVWPRGFDEYESGIWGPADHSVSGLFEVDPPHPFDPPCFMPCLRAKCLAVLTRVSVFATSCTPEHMKTPEFDSRFEEYEKLLDVFFGRLPLMTYDPSSIDSQLALHSKTMTRLNPSVLVNHMIILIAYIQLYNAFKDLILESESERFRSVYEKRLRIAKRGAELMQIWNNQTPNGFRDWGMWGAYVWFPIARVVAQHIRKLQSEKEEGDAAPALDDTMTELAIVLRWTETYEDLPITQLQLDKLSAYISGEDNVLATHFDTSSVVITPKS